MGALTGFCGLFETPQSCQVRHVLSSARPGECGHSCVFGNVPCPQRPVWPGVSSSPATLDTKLLTWPRFLGSALQSGGLSPQGGSFGEGQEGWQLFLDRSGSLGPGQMLGEEEGSALLGRAPQPGRRLSCPIPGRCGPVKTLREGFAAKSFQSCPTLCDPIDGSPPGSSVPGILQVRIPVCRLGLSQAGHPPSGFDGSKEAFQLPALPWMS